MMPKVTAAMCGLSAVVVAMALRASQTHPTKVVSGVAQAGVVVTGPSAGPPSAHPKATPKPRRRHVALKVVTTPTGAATPSHRTRPTRSAAPSPAPVTTTTVNGQAIDTQYGPVQVQIVIRGRRIVQANAIEYPQDTSRDQEINGYAIPQLNQETLQAQSSQIDAVSGATYTSEGYINSLQSAIDQAHAAGVF